MLIEDCATYSNDDCIAAAAYPSVVNTRGSGEVTVRRFLGFNPRAQGIRLAWDEVRVNQAPFGAFTFEDADFVSDGLGVLIHQRKYGAIRMIDCDFEALKPKARGMDIQGATPLLELTRVSLPGPVQATARIDRLVTEAVIIEDKPLGAVPGPLFKAKPAPAAVESK